MKRPDDFAREVWAGGGGAAGAALRLLLAPAEAGYRGVVAARNAAYDRGWVAVERVPVPVISVGNLSVGGAGKTPFAAWLARRVADGGRKPAIALRGYGEDEIVLHRELNPDIPVFRAARRIEAAREAVAAGRDVVVLDDAFQHRALARDLDLVLIPTEGWDPDPRVLPRGPWREGLRALERADAVVLTRKGGRAARAEEVAAEIETLRPGMTVVRCALLPSRLVRLREGTPEPLDVLRGAPVLTVAALATPEPFLQNLRDAGARVEAALYPDHYAFAPPDVEVLVRRAEGRRVVMTQKDAVKLRPLLAGRVDAYVLEQRVTIESGAEALDQALRRALQEPGR